MTATCKTCPYFDQNDYMREHDTGGECRRNAPVLFELPGEYLNFPIVKLTDWCGEHPDRLPRIFCAETTLVTHDDDGPSAADMRRIVDALEKMATCAAVKP